MMVRSCCCWIDLLCLHTQTGRRAVCMLSWTSLVNPLSPGSKGVSKNFAWILNGRGKWKSSVCEWMKCLSLTQAALKSTHTEELSFIHSSSLAPLLFFMERPMCGHIRPNLCESFGAAAAGGLTYSRTPFSIVCLDDRFFLYSQWCKWISWSNCVPCEYDLMMIKWILDDRLSPAAADLLLLFIGAAGLQWHTHSLTQIET